MRQPALFAPAAWSVTELTRYIRQRLEGDELLQDVRVSGEISNFKRATSGHLYFTLKDPAAALQCVIWRSTAQRIRLELQNGLAVDAHGAITLYERDGSYQLIVSSLRLAGEGQLYLEFVRLKAELEAEGLFDPSRKRPIPERPRRIGIVTSATGAALQDMLNTLVNRYRMAEVVVAPAAVQGVEAPPQITAALSALQRLSPLPDVILVARGGGSLEDLWAFNDERVVRAVANCAVPVISGVGHETDFTLTDFAADLRAPTPTGAAVAAVPPQSDLQYELAGLWQRAEMALLTQMQGERAALDEAAQRMSWASPLRRVQMERQGLDRLVERRERAAQQTLALRRVHVQALEKRLAGVNPTAVLQRGYAWVSDARGQMVRSVGQVQAGERVTVRVADGTFGAQVSTPPRPADGSPKETE